MNIWTSIIHVTKGENVRDIGDRIPAVFLRRWFWTARIVVCSAVSEDRNFRRSFHAMLNKEYDITIQQSQIGGRYMYQVIVSGKRIVNEVNRHPKKFTNVKLYTSDPWYAAFTSDLGTISNLKIENHE